jgi:nicotinamide mononucleotide transporter
VWSTISQFLSVETIAFTVLGYPLSYVELLGTIFNLWSVWLVARNHIATWPVGIVGVLLFLVLFYQIRLYSDTFEQIYYLVASVYGWWQWSRGGAARAGGARAIRLSAPRSLAAGVAATLALSLLLGWLMSDIHLLLPGLFPEPASYPYLDALTTVMSITATLLMAHRRLECWVYWIIVDIIGVGLYYAKDVRFLALLYAIFLVLAANGLLTWRRRARAEEAL